MDSSSLDTLRYRLQNYTSAIRETREQVLGRERTGTSPAYAPYYERARVLSLFDALAEAGTALPPDLWQEYARITRRFERFERDAGPAYRNELLTELAKLIQAYHAALCFAYLGGSGECEASRQPEERVIIGLLLNELKKDHDLSDMQRLITCLDRNVASITVARTDQESPAQSVMMGTACDATPRCNRGIP